MERKDKAIPLHVCNTEWIESAAVLCRDKMESCAVVQLSDVGK